MERPRFPLAPRAVLERVRTELARPESDALLHAAALRLTDRAERVLDRLDDTARVLEQLARTELAIVERLLPIVDDLGALVRLTLQDARKRLGGAPERATPPAPKPRVIDVP